MSKVSSVMEAIEDMAKDHDLADVVGMVHPMTWLDMASVVPCHDHTFFLEPGLISVEIWPNELVEPTCIVFIDRVAYEDAWALA